MYCKDICTCFTYIGTSYSVWYSLVSSHYFRSFQIVKQIENLAFWYTHPVNCQCIPFVRYFEIKIISDIVRSKRALRFHYKFHWGNSFLLGVCLFHSLWILVDHYTTTDSYLAFYITYYYPLLLRYYHTGVI